MEGSAIKNCTATGSGGGVYSGHYFFMEGGAIENCKAAQGGGVYNEGGTCTMQNSAAIERCTATKAGGGVYVAAGKKVELLNTPQVKDNTVDGERDNIALAPGAQVQDRGLDEGASIGISLHGEGWEDDAVILVDSSGNPISKENIPAYVTDDTTGEKLTSTSAADLPKKSVTPPPPPPTPDRAIALDKTELALEPGQTAKLKATLTPADATYKYIFWESSDEAIATVSDSGVVTAVADGTAAITAKSWYGNTATCAVAVKTPEPPTPTDPWPTEGLAGFVTRCYRVALFRDPDQAGHADWVRWLQDGTVDATSCTYGFVFSKEMNNKNLSDEAFVKTLYNLFMDREGEAIGVAFWTEYLQAGHSRLEVFHGFADSTEFARIKINYGIQ